MILPVLTEIGIFLIPFAIYAAFLFGTRAGVLHPESWPLRTIAKLALVSLVLTTVSLVLLAHFSGAPPGTTDVPARIENGKLSPGADK